LICAVFIYLDNAVLTKKKQSDTNTLSQEWRKDTFLDSKEYLYDMRGYLKKTNSDIYSEPMMESKYYDNNPSLKDVIEALQKLEEQKNNRIPPRVD